MPQIVNLEEYHNYTYSPKNIERNIANPERFLMEGALIVVSSIMPNAVIEKFIAIGINNFSIEEKESICRNFLNAVFFGNMPHTGNHHKQMVLDLMVTAYEDYVHNNPTSIADIAKMAALVMLQKLGTATDVCMNEFKDTSDNLGKFADNMKDINKVIDILI